MKRKAMQVAGMTLAVTAMLAGCTASAAPAEHPAVPATTASSAAVTPAVPWPTMPPLTRAQLEAALLTVQELPSGASTEPGDSTMSADTAAMLQKAAADAPACAPIITALSPEQQTARAEQLYVLGNNTLANRLSVVVSSSAAGQVRARFRALETAVNGGCPSLTFGPGGVSQQVEVLHFEGAEVPVISFQLTTAPVGGLRNRVVLLFAGVGDNQLLFSLNDDVTNNPVLPAAVVRAQIHKFAVTAGHTGT